MDRLVVGDIDRGDEARDLWRDHGHIAADIGVVRALDEAPDRPPMFAIAGGADPDDEPHAGQSSCLRDVRPPAAIAASLGTTKAEPLDGLAHEGLPCSIGARRSAGACARSRPARRRP